MTPEDIANALKGKKTGSCWLAKCPSHQDKTPSLSISLSAEGKLLVHCFSGCSQKEVIDSLRNLGLWPSRNLRHNFKAGMTPELPQVAPESSCTHLFAMNIWEKAKQANKTPVSTYLASRAINTKIPETIRFAKLKHPSGDIWPAMVALVQGSDGKPLGIHRTFLAPDGTAKAPVDPAKMMLGSCATGAVRLAEADDFLMVAEGIETAMAGHQATGYPTWAALSASGMRNLLLPDSICTVLILADGDSAGISAAVACGRRWRAEGRQVQIAEAPAGRDFNDLLIESNTNRGDS